MSEQLFSGAIATEHLVGRTAEIETIRSAITAQDSRFHCVLIRADGGKGKTRLLSTIDDHIEQWGVPIDTVVLLPLVDVSDPLLHSISAFLDRIYQHLRELRDAHKLAHEQFQVFEVFENRLRDYREARDRGTAYNRVMEQRDDMIKAFERAYEQLTQGARVVWVLDTMEQLFTAAPEIDELLKYDFGINSAEIGPSTYQWLHNFILHRPTNTSVLLAGRPEPSIWAHKIEEALLGVSSGANSPPLPPEVRAGILPIHTTSVYTAPIEDISPSIQHIELGNFSQAESIQYLKTLREQLQLLPEYAPITEYLTDMQSDTAQLEVLHRLTEGNPIRLALYIDLLVNSSSFPEAMHSSLDELLQMDERERQKVRTGIDRALLTYIARNMDQAQSEVLGYLSVMRRGLDIERLLALSGGDRSEAEAALQRLRRMSFVKYRSDDLGERYYLHDELYSIYQREFTDGSEADHELERRRQQQIFTNLIAFCQNELKSVNAKLMQPAARTDPSLAQEEQEKRRILRARRRALQIELLHYQLYRDPREAFNTIYLELGEQALSTSDPELNDQLQAELELFFFGGEERAWLNQLQTRVEERHWNPLRFSVIHARITNLIRRLIQAKKYAIITRFVEQAANDHRALVEQVYPTLAPIYNTPGGQLRNAYFRSEWQAGGQFAAIYLGGKETQPAITNLIAIAGQIEGMLRDDPNNNLPLMRQGEFSPYYVFRMQNLVALIYMYIGYGYATLNAFSEAKRAYQRADYILLKTPPDDQVVHAELKNNLARTMAELGATRIARTLCDEGIDFSRRLGLEYRVAIGFNTKALIYTLDHRPDEAYQNATDALQIFRQLNDARGIGLAQIQVGEACRRRFNSLYERLPAPRPTQIPADLHAILEQANTALAEAAEIFGSDADDVGSTSSALQTVERVPERSRLIETRVYQGCLYRDWANTLGQQPGNDIFDRAVKAFDEALVQMREEGYQRLRLSALIDKAWLYKRSKHAQVAWEIAQVALAEAPTHHMLTPERSLDPSQAFDPVVFRELSKLESLFADIDEQAKQFADSFSHRALAITYLQLFSSSETTYLGLNVDKLYQLLNNARKEEQDRQRDFLPLSQQIVQRYHLDQLCPRIGPLRFLQIVEDSFAPLTDLTYLRETLAPETSS